MTEKSYMKLHTALAVATIIFCLAMVCSCVIIWIKVYFAIVAIASLIALVRLRRRRK